MKTEQRYFQLNQSMWNKVKHFLPSERGRNARPSKSNKLMVEAMLWKLRTGAPWRDIPRHIYGPWESVYTRFSRWSKAGYFHLIFHEMKDDLGLDTILLDSTTIKVHQHGHGALKKRVIRR